MSNQEIQATFKQLGRSGARVSNLCLGCMNFGGRVSDEKESARVIHRFLDAGFNFLDTANVYSRGQSEIHVGKAITGRRDQVFLATKVHGKMGDGPNDLGNSRVHIMKSVEDSLRRLQTDYIDLYWLHRPDPHIPIDETLRTMDDLVRQGKVRYIGVSTFPAWQTMEALATSDKMNLERVVAEQPPYNLLDRAIEEDVIPLCQKYGLGIMPWGPLAAGWLSGRYRKDQPFPDGTRVSSRTSNREARHILERLETIEKLIAFASEREISLVQLSLAWLLHQPAVTAPIIGPRTLEQLEENLAAVQVRLREEDLRLIDAIVPPKSRVGDKKHNE